MKKLKTIWSIETEQDLGTVPEKIEECPSPMIYTGPPCMCGDPTPFTPEEKEHSRKMYAYHYWKMMDEKSNQLSKSIDELILKEIELKLSLPKE